MTSMAFRSVPGILLTPCQHFQDACLLGPHVDRYSSPLAECQKDSVCRRIDQSEPCLVLATAQKSVSQGRDVHTKNSSPSIPEHAVATVSRALVALPPVHEEATEDELREKEQKKLQALAQVFGLANDIQTARAESADISQDSWIHWGVCTVCGTLGAVLGTVKAVIHHVPVPGKGLVLLSQK